jgi:DNA adenine methylase
MLVVKDISVKTPFRYAGGKYYALKYLLPFVNTVTHEEYREPFVGGGSVFFGKNRVVRNVINDIDPELIHMYEIIKDKSKLDQLVALFDNEIATKERHTIVKNMSPNNEIERAFLYYYINRTSYSGIMKKPAWGYRDDKSSPPHRWANMLYKAHEKLQDTEIYCKDFAEIIEESTMAKSVLIYLDPPYFEADQKRAYKNHFLIADHERLCKLLKKTPYTFLLSYDDIPAIREMYSWANIYPLTWNYNTSNLNGTSRKLGRELLISNASF